MIGPAALSGPSDGHDVVQEDDIVASRKVSAVLVAGVLATLAAVAVAGWILSFTMAGLAVHPPPPPRVAPREIAGIHQTPIERGLHGWELRERQRRSLDDYRWIDRGRGIAQIPIEEAMKMVVVDATKGAGSR